MRAPPDPRTANRIVYKTLVVVNLMFAALVLGAWWLVAGLVADPISWATWQALPEAPTWEQAARYPYLMLWAFPVLCVWAAWVAREMHRRKLSVGIALVPVLSFGVTIAWFHLAPTHWH